MRSRTIGRCQTFLTKCAQLATVEEYKNFSWSWPGNHQGLHAIMILLIDLVQDPESSTAIQSRRVIDIIFALNGPQGGLVAGSGTEDDIMKRPLTEGGQETWEYLRRLRSKAWQKAGLDPDVVWTRDQAVQYCHNAHEPEVLAGEQGPMWSQASPESFEGMSLARVSQQAVPGAEALEDIMMSPPNLDWAYIDEVLSGGQQMELEMDLPPFDQEGS